ncbi:hypothetical protein P171DRAFT_469959 [Karstenula rhodostoma CBS 690.94]|uniref:Uncharacterized protein n=1 Tax=Karstenula rhodostoma CBS 690.94 TaxID=1392251 RepID=A0A9P4PRS3_9PLEO|nr:hypothetical protein P171DRAFT_469959 [Karstenula rhodostoma CBS 690.94]
MSITTPFPPTVTALITPTLLTSLFTLEIPWPKSTPPTAPQWSAPHSSPAAYKPLCWPALLALSTIPLPATKTLNWFTLLPAPTDPAFPIQAVGLTILLDQAPRHLCTHAHERWRNAFFDPLALSLTLALRKLPASSSIHDRPRWQQQGWSMPHFQALSNFLAAPLAHAELLAVHTALLLPEVAARRRLLETYYAVRDSWHGTALATSATATAEFARLFAAAVPAVEVADTAFWWCRVLEAHTPILRAFGRYPYRNRAMGRVSTPAEVLFLEQTGDFGVGVGEGDAEGVRRDVEGGVWTALGDGEGEGLGWKVKMGKGREGAV